MKVVLLLALMLAGVAAEARDRTGQFGLGAGIGPVFPATWSQDRLKNAIDLGPQGGIWARYYFDSPSAGFELAGNYLTFSNSTTKVRAYTGNYFWRYALIAMPKVKPMWGLGIGLGELMNYFEKIKHTTTVFRIRLGAEYEINYKLDAGFYLDHYSVFRYNASNPDMHVLAPTLAINYYFGEPTIIPASTETVASKPAESNLDSDDDGVLDSKDRCPGTPKGESVNDLGCAVKQTFEVRLDVKFKPSTAALQTNSLSDVEELAKLMKNNSALKIEVQGHTDSAGKKSTNDKLSLARANAVRDVLIKKFGIDGNRIVAKGYGSSQPVASNSDASGRALNRRVTAKVAAQ